MKHLLILTLLLSSFLFGQELSQEMVMDKTLTLSAKMNPSGDWIAYSRYSYAESDSNESAKTELMAINRESKETRQFSFLPIKFSSFVWSKDGRHLIVQGKITDMCKLVQLYRIPLNGGGFEKLTNIKRSFSSWKFTPDEKQALYLSKKKVNTFDPIINDENKRFAKLYSYDLDSGEEAAISPDSLHVWSYSIMPDGKSVIIQATKDAGVDYSYMFRQLYQIDLADYTIKALVTWHGKMGTATASPDGRYLAVMGGIDISDPSPGSLFLIDMQKPLQRTNLTDGFAGTLQSFSWTDKNEITFVATVNAHREIWTVDLNGDTERESKLEMSISSLSFDNDKKYFATVASAYNHPQEIYVGRVGQSLERLTHSNPQLDGINFAKAEEISWQSRDGLTIYGVLYRPLNYESGKKYPLQMMVHGGPESADVLGWNNWYSKWPQIMAQKGAFVLLPNYRGSTGQGVEFTKKDHKDMMGKEFEDMLDGMDYLIDKGWVDTDKVGVSGGSYGGYTAAWAATKYSDRFAASIMFVGISNQVSKFGTTDTPHESANVHWASWPYEDNFELYWDRSPLKYAANNKTPILIASGEKDERVPPEQGRELYRALDYYGNAPVEFMIFKGEGHGNRKKGNRQFFQTKALEWLDTYLFGK